MDPSKNRRVLGRGLSSLLPNREPTKPQPEKNVESSSRVENTTQQNQQTVLIDKIKNNKSQPRKRFNPESMQELAQSIKEKGILQPLLVQQTDAGDYLLVAGERRLRAASLAGLREVPVVVRPCETPGESLELALIENIQREDLNPIEEAQAFKKLMDQFQLTQEQVAKKVGKQRSTVANSLRLLKLPANVVQYLVAGKLTAGQARPLLSLQDPSQMTEMADAIVSQGLTAREVEAKALGSVSSSGKRADATERRRAVSSTVVNPHLEALNDRLRGRFATKVEVKENRGKGRIVLHFFSLEELGRILELMGVD